MYEPITLKGFMDNPMGKGSMAITGLQLIKEDLNKRFYELKKRKEFKYTLYKDGDEYYFHFLSPSESKRNNTYDVIIKFCTTNALSKYENFINDYTLQFFSNCPSFTFTYASVFNSVGYLIPDFADIYGPDVIDNAPDIRNPNYIINYEKSIYFACKFILDSVSLHNKMYLNTIAKPFSLAILKTKLRTPERVHVEIAKENAKLKRIALNKPNETKSSRNDAKAQKKPPIQKMSGGHVIKPHKSTSMAKIKPVKSTTKKK